ncbi:unnamed protein product [Prunus armeniaca]|uniref:Uncharacterized protein n=1 Tax=Prunus armeniaca TaxID=36596 RepID=A0A6J5WJ93_PRUAR|nr:unnamed protein product [Prunus armeniaca]
MSVTAIVTIADEDGNYLQDAWEYNMNHLRLVWSGIWHVLSNFFVRIGYKSLLPFLPPCLVTSAPWGQTSIQKTSYKCKGRALDGSMACYLSLGKVHHDKGLMVMWASLIKMPGSMRHAHWHYN